MPYFLKFKIIVSNNGFLFILIIGFGIFDVRGISLFPKPPAISTTSTFSFSSLFLSDPIIL